MKLLSIVLLAAAGIGQASTAQAAPQSAQDAQAGVSAGAAGATAQLPIKPGEWKLVAVIHGADGDLARSFFSCMTETDLAHLVPQPAHLPKNLTCTEDSQTLTATGEVLVFSCQSPGSRMKNTYELTRNSETLVTGTMKMVADAGGQHQESTTKIAYQWQQAECVHQDAVKPAPSLNGPAGTTPDNAPPAAPGK